MASLFSNAPLLTAIAIAQDAPPSKSPAQSESKSESKSESEKELPEHAVWQWEEPNAGPQVSGIYRLAYSHDGKLLAVRNAINTVTILDLPSQQKLCTVQGHDELVNQMDFSPDGEHFLTVAPGEEEPIIVWQTQTGKRLKEFGNDFNNAYFSANGEQVVALANHEIQTFDWRQEKKITARKFDASRIVKRQAMNRDGTLVATTATGNGNLKQTQIISPLAKSSMFLEGLIKMAKAVAFSSNDNWVAACYHGDSRVRIWDLRDPRESNFYLKQHTLTVASLCFSPDNRFLVTTSFDDTAIVWEMLTRQPIAYLKGHTENVNACAVSPLELRVATGSSGRSDNRVIIWDLKPFLFSESPPTDPPRSFGAAWSDLGSSDLGVVMVAIQTMVDRGEDWLVQLDKQLGLADRSTHDSRFQDWIAMLDDPKYSVREQATNKLIESRGFAERELKAALAQTNSAEVRHRLIKILDQPIQRPKIEPRHLRRLHRSIFALELAATEQAQRMLARIGESHPNIDVARDARESLLRIERRESEN